MIREQAEPLEADLARYYSTDLTDHWRRDERGRRRLSLRRIRVLVLYLPAESAIRRLGDPSPHWSLTHVLLAHVWQAAAQSKTPHPMLAAEVKRLAAGSASSMTTHRRKALADARRRAAERRRAIEAGEIT